MIYKIQIYIALIVGKLILKPTGYRFSKNFRWGITWWHRLVYSIFCTYVANLIADGADYRNWLK